MIDRHPCPLNRAPGLRVREQRQRASQRIKERFGRVFAKDESGTASWTPQPVGDIHDRIRQPADGADNRHCAIPKTVHLIEAARLEPLRHQKHVSARFDEVREPFIEADTRSDPVGMGRGQRGPELLIPRVTRPEGDERRIEVR
jgi:hypothetical protein